jgi:predicted nucleic acid-binding protein
MSDAKPLLFLDTNVLLYWLDTKDVAKQQMARKWVLAVWEAGQGRVSWQVLNEFYSNAVGKLRAPVREARAMVEVFVQLTAGEFGLPLIRRAWHWIDSAGISYWDASILASAEIAGCSYLLSEDFQTGRKFGEVTVVNPFKASPESILGAIPPPPAHKS